VYTYNFGVLHGVMFYLNTSLLLMVLNKARCLALFSFVFVGALAYADDIVLVSSSATTMHKLLHACDLYVAEYNILFNASKSKRMVISPSRCRSIQYCEFVLKSKPMEFVLSYVHFGHLLTDRLDDSTDISQR